jgi:hypothetical protein
MTAKDIDQFALLLAEGEAVWIALAFDRQAWSRSSVKSGYLPPYPRQDGLGHAVVLQGYRTGPTGRELLFQNSWGTKWGMDGYLWITEAMLRTHLLHAYRLRVSEAAGAPNLPPSLPTAPAASCSSGQTALLGVCLPIAPSSLPSIGNCPAGTLPNLLSPGRCVAVPRTF